jgi:hypothetical protein
MNGGAVAFALNERALQTPLFPPHPLFHRALEARGSLVGVRVAVRGNCDDGARLLNGTRSTG